MSFTDPAAGGGGVRAAIASAMMMLMSPSVSPAISEADDAAILSVAQRLVATARLDEFGAQLVQFALSRTPAERGLLLVPRTSGWLLHTLVDGGGTVRFPDAPVDGEQLPLSLLERTIAAGRPQAVREPASHADHAADPYFRRERPPGALCVPLCDRGGLAGLLYLESGGSSADFSEAGIERLHLLGALIAGSLRGAPPSPAMHDDLKSAAEEDRRRLAEAQALARIGSWEWDAERDVLTGSAEFHRLFDVEPSQMADYPAFIARLHPGDRVRVGVEVEAVLGGRQSCYDTEYRVVLADGTIRHLHARGQAEVDATGRCRGLFGTCQDVSDRRRADDAIRAAQEQLEQRVQERTADLHRSMAYTRSLIEAIGDPLLIIDVDGLVTDLNQAAELATGQARVDLIGTHFADLFTDPGLARDAQRRAFDRGAARGYELELRHAGGQVMPVLFDATVYRDQAGRVAGICGAARDIAEIRRTRAELLKNQQLLDEAGRLALVGGWEFDPVTRELSWTRVVYQIHEVAPYYRPTLEQAVRFVAPEAAPALSAAIDAALQRGEPFDLELPLITAQHRRIWVRWVGQAYWHEGRVARVGGLIRDVTERRQADEELRHHRDHLEELVAERTAALATTVADLERSNRDLEQFAYVASHDLQEPLRMVASYTQLLAERYRGRLDERADKYIGYAVDGATRMQGLINDLLAFSRVGTRGQAFVPTNTGQVVAEVLKDLEQAIDGSGAEIVVGELPVVPADRTQLRQVFQNLIENAIKFRGDAPPRVEVSAVKQAGAWHFTVKDNGIGIDPQYRDRIFLIFQRLHERGRYPGSGIGLAIVKKIVERHGGQIHLESAPGHGCSFAFSLPCTKGEPRGGGHG